jgi:hypothetical protein
MPGLNKKTFYIYKSEKVSIVDVDYTTDEYFLSNGVWVGINEFRDNAEVYEMEEQ